MMTTNISPTSIVVEVLRGDNYDDWSACMKSYMLAQDLWDFIEHTGHHEGDQEVDSKPIDHQEGDSKALRRKNAAALHAIQISCAPNILSKIRSITSAKDAWDTLSHKEQSVEEKSHGSGAVSNQMNGPLLTLYKYAHNGDWDAIRTYLSHYPNARKAIIKPYGGTALHVAAYSGHLRVVEELVKLMSVEELEIQEDQGRTALFFAAAVGKRKMAECLVRKNKNLVTFVNAQKKIPLVEACICNHKDMALYLYSVTPFEFLCQGNGHHGSYFLRCAIGAQMLDIALDFLHRCPCMATAKDEVYDTNPLFGLSNMPETFPSEGRLAFWQQWIYSCIPMKSITTTDENFRIDIPDQSRSESKNIIFQVSSKLRGFAINLLAFLGIKQIYDLKKIHIYSDKILRCMCEYISTLDYEQYLKADVHRAFHNAVRNGMVEFITEVIKACPHIMISGDDNSWNLFMSSIANRQEKVFSLFHGLEASRAGFVSLVDSS